MVPVSKRATVNDLGQVVIPREVLETIGLKVGDQVIFQVSDEGIQLIARADLVKHLQGVFTATGRDLTEERLVERREAAARKW
jgi:AbrB family looped-hinge helix DNA binding protein